MQNIRSLSVICCNFVMLDKHVNGLISVEMSEATFSFHAVYLQRGAHKQCHNFGWYEMFL